MQLDSSHKVGYRNSLTEIDQSKMGPAEKKLLHCCVADGLCPRSVETKGNGAGPYFGDASYIMSILAVRLEKNPGLM